MAKITKDERALAVRFVKKGKVALDALEDVYTAGEDLFLKNYWDIEDYNISRAAMLIGREVAGVADSILREGENE